MVEAHRDPVMRQWLRHPVTNADEARRIIQARRADSEAGIGFSFAVLLAEPEGPDDLVGGVSVRGLGDAAVSGEVGYWVTAPARGRGIAARAVDVVCDWAFRLPRDQPLERLELLHSVGNRASCRVAEKAGFRFSAVLPPLLPDFPDDGHLHVRLADEPQGRLAKGPPASSSWHGAYHVVRGWLGAFGRPHGKVGH